MTQPSRRFKIWERLSSRFLIEPVPADATPAPGVGTEIIPVTHVDELLRETQTAQALAVDISGAVAFNSMFTVPEGKRWRVKNIHREATTGTSQVAVRGSVGGVIAYLTILATAEQVWSGTMVLEQTDQVGLMRTGNGADTSIDTDIIYEEEDAF